MDSNVCVSKKTVADTTEFQELGDKRQ